MHIRSGMSKCVHTMPKSDGGWLNRCGREVLSEHEAKSRAVLAGRHQAQDRHAEHVIYLRDGRIGELTSYGHATNGSHLS